MRFPLFSAALAALCLALPAAAQDIKVFGGKGTRGASTLLMFGNNKMAGMSVSYGEPEWKDSHNGEIDKLKGHLVRLGKDWWATFSTSAAIEIGGTKVPAGTWLIGLQCDKDGKFSLTFLDATKGMQQGAMPFPNEQMEMNWKPDLVAPLTFNKDVNKDVVVKMSIELTADKKDPSKGMFTVSWGKHTLTGAMTISLAK